MTPCTTTYAVSRSGVSTLLFLIGGSVGSAVVAGISGPLGMPAALLVLAVLPLLGLVVLAPTLRAAAGRRLTAVATKEVWRDVGGPT